MTLKLPTLYKLTSKGKVQTWEQEVDGAVITTTHGQQDGKKQVNSETIYEGKNIGKANATTPEQQAEAEARSRWTKKQDRQGYSLTIEAMTEEKVNGGGVMLAHKYSEHADKMSEVCYSQPKLDGHRCKAVIRDKVCTLYSRTNDIILGVPHINRYLEQNFNNTILDGELYNHDYKDKFEELTSFIRQKSPIPGHEIVFYYVYDLISTPEHSGSEMKYSDRYSWLHKHIKGDGAVKLIANCECVGPTDIEAIFKACREQGFEGSMVRNPEAVYEHKRSYNLQKVKEMDDAEFKVIDITEGRGKMEGHAMLRCELPDDTFDCKLKGSFENLKQMFENKNKYIGRMVTVQFQGYTKYGKPRFPVGLRFREDV